jgi:hypothetical protein
MQQLPEGAPAHSWANPAAVAHIASEKTFWEVVEGR